MGEDVSKSLRWLPSEVVVTFTSFECSKEGRSGSEGTSFCSSASILRQILDGVSTSAILMVRQSRAPPHSNHHVSVLSPPHSHSESRGRSWLVLLTTTDGRCRMSNMHKLVQVRENAFSLLWSVSGPTIHACSFIIHRTYLLLVMH